MFARVVVVLHRLLERSAGAPSLSIPQYRFLLTMKRGPRRASDLAAISGIGRPAASVLVTELERRGYIERYADPDDGRAEMLRLTVGGLGRFADFERMMAEEMAEFIDVKDSDALLDGLELLAHHIDRKRERHLSD